MKTIDRRSSPEGPEPRQRPFRLRAPFSTTPGSLWPTAEAPGYFEREFAVTDAVCRRILAKALAKGAITQTSISSTHQQLSDPRRRQGKSGL